MKKSRPLCVVIFSTLCVSVFGDDGDFGQHNTSDVYDNNYGCLSKPIAFSSIIDTRPPSGYKQDAYGPGVHSNPYGGPISFEVIGQPGASTNFLEIRPNAYGIGVHSDQYGRPIRDVPYNSW